MRKIDYIIEKDSDGDKVLWYLRGKAKLSARLVASLKTFPEGILLNGEHIRTVDRIHTGDVLTVNIPSGKNSAEGVDGELDIVYEDDDLLIINKNPFIAVHPTHNHQGDTLANVVAGYLDKKGKSAVFRAVGRLDKGTSGLIIIALNAYSASRLSEEGVSKTYLAIADGVFCEGGTINKPIYRPDPMKTMRAVGDTGDIAVTHYEPLKNDGKRTLLKIWLETGRTHQIRVHFSSVGAPLMGDSLYGEESREILRHALHCHEIKFSHPVTRKEIIVSAEMPDDMKKIAKKM